jgi:hypothetical protein
MPNISIGVGGVWKSVTAYIGVGGAWKLITGAWIGAGDSYHVAWASMNAIPMSLSVSPTSASGSIRSSSLTRQNVTSNSVTVTVSGGTGPFTHAWSVAFDPSQSADSTGTCAADNPTSATTTFTGLTVNTTLSPESDGYIATDTVTDTSSGGVTSIAVPIILSNNHVSRF